MQACHAVPGLWNCSKTFSILDEGGALGGMVLRAATKWRQQTCRGTAVYHRAEKLVAAQPQDAPHECFGS